MTDEPKKAGGLSLYAHLLGGDKAGSSGSTISGAPVRYDQPPAKAADDDDAAGAKKAKDASLHFQPIKRPQIKAKPKPAPASSTANTSSSAHKFSSSTTTASVPPQGASSTPSVQRSNFEDWVGDEDDEFYYQDRKQSNRRNKKKKQQQQQQQQEAQAWGWDDIYDPTRPNNYVDYKGSEEQYREHRDWKARLYYYQLKDAKRAKKSDEPKRAVQSMFAPPANLNFAPPSFDDPAPPQRMDMDEDDDYYPPPASASDGPARPSFAPPSFAPPILSDDATGDDAYQRRMQMSGMPPPAHSPPQSSPPKNTSPPLQQPPPPPPPPPPQQSDADKAVKLAEAQAKIAAFKAKMAKPPTPSQTDKLPSASPAEPTPSPPPPPPEPAGTISRAPVRYDVPARAENAGDDSSVNAQAPQEDQPRSKKPGQKGFAERLLNKYGWEKGQGLGASGEGITTALIGKADKSKGKKRTDPDGGRLPPVTMGKIVGGKRRKVEGAADDENGKFGKMSDVIKLEGMLAGLDVQKEIEDNNLLQEVGEEMGEKYGTVERVYVWREEQGGNGEVFVKFTSQLSALRAVNAMDETTFAGNAVVARFFDGEAFEKGEYAK